MKQENKQILKIIGLIIAVLAITIPLILAMGASNQKVDDTIKRLDAKEIKDDTIFTVIDNRMVDLEKVTAGTGVYLSEIKSDISEIKEDLKEISRDLKNN